MAEDLDAEVERLLGVGATLVERRGDESFRWVTLADPDGNQFCVAGSSRRLGVRLSRLSRAAIASPKTSVWRSTSASVWCGLNSAMLWNGVSRMPRLRAQRCRKRLEVLVDGGGGGGAVAWGWAEPVLRAAAEALDVPGQVVVGDHVGDARR